VNEVKVSSENTTNVCIDTPKDLEFGAIGKVYPGFSRIVFNAQNGITPIIQRGQLIKIRVVWSTDNNLNVSQTSSKCPSQA
jgi:hypothetical protein